MAESNAAVFCYALAMDPMFGRTPWQLLADMLVICLRYENDSQVQEGRKASSTAAAPVRLRSGGLGWYH